MVVKRHIIKVVIIVVFTVNWAFADLVMATIKTDCRQVELPSKVRVINNSYCCMGFIKPVETAITTAITAVNSSVGSKHYAIEHFVVLVLPWLCRALIGSLLHFCSEKVS